ncbi:MAG TPA: galactokinase family protein [Vicinamibacterales bacterium]
MSTQLAEVLVAAGVSEAEAAAKARLLAATAAALDRHGNSDGPTRQYFVPGRVEVLGKHTDYAGGRSLLCAAERGFLVSARPRRDDRVTVIDVVHGAAATFRLSPDQEPCPHWHNYPSTVVRRIVRNFGAPLEGVDIAIGSDLPRASGMSSSTALIIATFLAIADRNGLPARAPWQREITCTEDLAAYLGTVENGSSFGTLTGDRGVGTHGGSQDHTAILCAEPGRLVRYRFGPVAREATVPLHDRVFVVASSGITASKAGEARDRYNRAVDTLHALLRIWQARTGETPPTLGQLLGQDPEALERLRRYVDDTPQPGFAPHVLRNRLEQFVLEALVVVPGATQALEAGDFATFGELVDRSQRAAEGWLENQIPETSALARLARSLGAEAASAFGAGFGGSVWALVPTADADRFAAAWREAYAARFPALADRAEFFPTRPGPPVVRL